MTVTVDRTVGEIVASDYRAAAVFEKHALDFCCKGGRSLEEACAQSGLDPDEVRREIEAVTAEPDAETPRINTWDLSTLVGYIVSQHHSYVRAQMPTVLAHARKIATVHGERHPELRRVASVFQDVVDEMTSHMMKEEQILFPYISALDTAAREGGPAPAAPFGTVENPVHMMEMEHESAGAAMEEIRRLTDRYSVPDDACTTYRVCLQELEAFERDLHQHVHLENNILFPKAIALEHQV